jgi:putative addiction module killer protein
VYYVKRGENLIVLLAGGDKDTQAKDIAQAITLASEL